MKYIFIFLGVYFFSPAIHAQIDYHKIKKQKLFPIQIDTLSEQVLVIQKKFAIIYFRQSDIKQYLEAEDTLGVRINRNHSNLDSLLSLDFTKIKLTDWWFDYTDEERERLFGNKNYSNQDKIYLSELRRFGADLIHDGKFMLLDRTTKKIIIKKMRIKRIKGLFGTRYVEFQLPDNKSFWDIVTRFGE